MTTETSNARGEVVAVPKDVIDFLMGEGELQGAWFGETPTGERGQWFWRKHLRQAAAAPPPAAARGDVRAPITDDALIAGWEAKAEAYEKTDDYADQVRAWQLRDCANELRTRKALAAEGVQAGEVGK